MRFWFLIAPRVPAFTGLPFCRRTLNCQNPYLYLVGKIVRIFSQTGVWKGPWRMDAHLKHLLKLINAEAEPADNQDESDRRPASDADMELLDAYSRAVFSVVDVESVDDLHRFLAEWPMGRPVEIDVIRDQRHQILEVTPQEAGV
jgi:hypothetical protein